MSTRTLNLEGFIYDYYQSVAYREHESLKSLRAETEKLTSFNMQIAPEQGAFMAMLVKLIGAKHILEVGTFTGYSSLSMALALPEDGELLALDISKEWTSIAQKYWQLAGVDHKTRLILAPALNTMKKLLDQQKTDSFDLIFIDADKTGYNEYYEKGLLLVRRGGLMLFDNVLWGGDVADLNCDEPDTLSLREFNQKLVNDPRIDLTMIPIGDGLTLARKK